MLFYFDDNTAGAVSYSTAWTTYVGDNNGRVNATSWYGGTLHSCSASSETSLAAGCNATITFSGTKIWVIGDWNPAQGRFYCALLDEGQPWRWLNGSSLSSPFQGQTGLNHTRCQLSGLEDKQHTLVFGQTQGDVIDNGITLDYYVVDNSTDNSLSTLTWASDFIASKPADGYDWSVQVHNSSGTTSAISSFTSITTSSASHSSTTSVPSGSSTTAIGVGVGVGVGCAALLAIIAVWLFLRRRRTRDSDARTVVTEPHHELKVHLPPAGGWTADEGGYMPYEYAADGHASSLSDHRDGSFGGPEPVSASPHNALSSYGGSASDRLESPATFRPRGS